MPGEFRAPASFLGVQKNETRAISPMRWRLLVGTNYTLVSKEQLFASPACPVLYRLCIIAPPIPLAT